MRYTYDNDLLPERAFTRLGKHLTTLEGKSSPAPPDYKPMAAANEKAAKYGYDAATNDLAFRKQQYADAQPRLEQLYDMAGKVGQSQLEQMRSASEKSDAQWNDYLSTYRPLEQKVAAEAAAAGGKDDQELAARDAISGSRQQAALADASTTRQLESMGINPNSAKFAGGLRSAGVMNAANAAGAATNAKTNAVNRGMSLRAGAAATGRGQVNTSGQMMGLSGNAGAGATGAATTGANGNLGWANFVGQGTGNQLQAGSNAITGNNGLMNAMNNSYSAQVQAANADSGFGSMLGTLGGAAITRYSDIRLKEHILFEGEENGHEIYSFSYIAGKGLPEGRFVGVMAQSVAISNPDAVVVGEDGYLLVDYAKIGIEMRAL